MIGEYQLPLLSGLKLSNMFSYQNTFHSVFPNIHYLVSVTPADKEKYNLKQGFTNIVKISDTPQNYRCQKGIFIYEDPQMLGTTLLNVIA
jgi:hypothetical protein